MGNVTIRMRDGGWAVEVDGEVSLMYQRLKDTIRRADCLAGEVGGAGWTFADELLRAAATLAQDRAVLRAREAELLAETDRMIVVLAEEGLSNNDIALLLGLTAARVSQIVQDTAVPLWGDESDGELQLVKLQFGKGWRAGFGWGPLPADVYYAGRRFVRNGSASQVNGQPWRHTYVEG